MKPTSLKSKFMSNSERRRQVQKHKYLKQNTAKRRM